jgi:hypothetical protein
VVDRVIPLWLVTLAPVAKPVPVSVTAWASDPAGSEPGVTAVILGAEVAPASAPAAPEPATASARSTMLRKMTVLLDVRR